MRDLRALLVELHPPHLAAAGLEAAIADLVSPLQASGVVVTVAIEGADRLDREQEALVYRVAQEAVRNVIAYAEAAVAARRAERRRRMPRGSSSRTTVAGSRPSCAARRLAEGHLGLSLVEELARQSGGSLAISSHEGAGTRVELEVPSSMIRVVLADDHGVLRDGLGQRDRRAAGHGGRRARPRTAPRQSRSAGRQRPTSC